MSAILYDKSVGIFIGYGNGTFKDQQAYFTGGYHYPYYLDIGDFNDDSLIDVAFSYASAPYVGVLFGYGNGSLGGRAVFSSGDNTHYPRIAVGDLNNDGYAGITVGSTNPFIVYALVSYGNGNFETQTIFSTTQEGFYTWMNIGDFNNDGCQDLLAADDYGGSIDILSNTCKCAPDWAYEEVHP